MRRWPSPRAPGSPHSSRNPCSHGNLPPWPRLHSSGPSPRPSSWSFSVFVVPVPGLFRLKRGRLQETSMKSPQAIVTIVGAATRAVVLARSVQGRWVQWVFDRIGRGRTGPSPIASRLRGTRRCMDRRWVSLTSNPRAISHPSPTSRRTWTSAGCSARGASRTKSRKQLRPIPPRDPGIRPPDEASAPTDPGLEPGILTLRHHESPCFMPATRSTNLGGGFSRFSMGVAEWCPL